MPEPVAIAFADSGEPARINYRIPMPGAHTGRRIIELKLDFLAAGAYRAKAVASGRNLFAAAGIVSDERGTSVDQARAKDFFLARLEQSGFRVERDFLSLMLSLEAGTRTNAMSPGVAPTKAQSSAAAIGAEELAFERLGIKAEATKDRSRYLQVLSGYRNFLANLDRGIVMMPVRSWSGELRLNSWPGPGPEYATDAGDWGTAVTARPRFFLVERYGISSFLGDYGMGRTVKTFTLLPGETTTISLKTWQSTKQSMEESSSIVDSHEQSARDRFADTVQDETTDKATREETEEWHVEAELEASWGFGSAEVSGGGSGEYQSGREQFARQATEAIREHSADASSKRELSVSSSSERTEETGAETRVERTISNVNMRRVVNFVFRELNQTYITKLHLKDIRVAFTNGRYNSWREVPLSGLRQLLREVLQPREVDRIAQRILKVAGIVFDHSDMAIFTLDKVNIASNGSSVTVERAALGPDGEFPPPTDLSYYRFRRGPLNQSGSNPVDGVLLSTSEITMRTDSVIVEALLGQADALDSYAMESQEAAAGARTLANRREELLHEALRAVTNPSERLALAAQLFGPPPEEGD